MAFDRDSVPDQSGKVFVITGGNSGVGFEAARVLASRGGHVVLACRDEKKMHAARDKLLAESPKAQIDEVVLDLASMKSIRAAAEDIQKRFPRVDVLVNNAGVMAIPERETADGIEMQMGTNHFGHFALTGLLLPALLAAPAPRVVSVSSILHSRGHIVFEDIPKPARYDTNRQYAASKLANLLFARELDRRAKASKTGSKLVSTGAHPGYSATNLQYVGPDMEGSAAKRFMMKISNALIAQSAEMGALGTLYAATAPDVEGGEYIGPASLGGLRGHPVKGPSSKESRDETVARKLWEVSEKLTGVTYDALRG